MGAEWNKDFHSVTPWPIKNQALCPRPWLRRILNKRAGEWTDWSLFNLSCNKLKLSKILFLKIKSKWICCVICKEFRFYKGCTGALLRSKQTRKETSFISIHFVPRRAWLCKWHLVLPGKINTRASAGGSTSRQPSMPPAMHRCHGVRSNIFVD